MLIASLAVFLPLLAAIVAGLGCRIIGNRAANLVTCAAVLGSAAASVFLFNAVALHGASQTYVLADWITSGAWKVSWSLRLDTLSVVMLAVVTIVSAMVHIYAVGYMKEEKGVPRFMAYLSLFTFFMLMLVTADNLIQMFFGWEGVGLCSYLLIGFWYEKNAANAASMKAFLVNRIGDLGFSLGIFACFAVAGSVQFEPLFRAAPEMAQARLMLGGFSVPALTTLCLLLFVGAMGKSAQLGLHVWLPDAMEGPTPVSALIHAATMVTAGVFMVARLSPLFEYAPDALAVIAIVGGLTAVFAAVIGLTQFDIKRVIAYSTMSQLGYMFFALGVSAYSAAIFHLATHAFFKALLFLGAGVVIHAMAGEQDMRKMGGLWRKMPYTYALMWIGSLALAGIGLEGIFGFAGFYSKDAVLASALASHTPYGKFVYALGLLAAFMTAFYSLRLIVLTFHGSAHEPNHAHDASPAMIMPLFVLAAGAVFAGFAAQYLFVGEGRLDFWRAALFVLPGQDPLPEAHHLPYYIKAVPVLIALLGAAVAYLFYIKRPQLPALVASKLGVLYRIVFNKFYFDEAYAFLFIRPAEALGRFFWHVGDDKIIDPYGPHGVAEMVRRAAQKISLLQTGTVTHYAFAMMVGMVLLVTWFLIRGAF